MELFEIQNMLKQGNKPKFLIFVGSDYFIANSYVNNLAKYFGLEKVYIEDVDILPVLSRGDAMFSVDRLFIWKYPKDISSHEHIFEDMDSYISDNIIIIILSDIDKRTKFYTQYKDHIVNCAPQDYKTFKEMIGNQTKMSSDNIKALAEICGNNYGKFLTELDKVKRYSESQNIDENQSFTHLVECGVIYTGNRDVIFNFIDRVMNARNNLYEHYVTLKHQEESNIKLISLLYSAFRNQFICETVTNPTQDNTGLTPFIISQCLRRKGIYSSGDLRKALKLLQKLEQGVKSGLYEEYQIVDHFLAEFLL